jgi:hypothetical protein
MKQLSIIAIFLLATICTKAQDTVTASTGKITVIKDPRLDILAKKEYEYNIYGNKTAKGYRLLIISSNDRDKVMAARSKLLQNYPDQKVYMQFQFPNIKLKFGNFVEKPDAEKMRDQLARLKIVENNIYVVSDIVEVKLDKNKQKEDE